MREFKALLWEADGTRRQWTVRFCRIPPEENGDRNWGTCDWDKRLICIESCLRKRDSILDTMMHEGAHAAAGVNGSEWLIEAIEDNHQTLRKAFDA